MGRVLMRSHWVCLKVLKSVLSLPTQKGGGVSRARNMSLEVALTRFMDLGRSNQVAIAVAVAKASPTLTASSQRCCKGLSRANAAGMGASVGSAGPPITSPYAVRGAPFFSVGSEAEERRAPYRVRRRDRRAR